MLLTVIEALPTLLSVSDCGVEVVPTDQCPNFRPCLLTDNHAPGVPVPDRPTWWGLPNALSVNASAAVLTPAPSGRKRSSAVQEAPAATVWPVQVSFERRKLAA